MQTYEFHLPKRLPCASSLLASPYAFKSTPCVTDGANVGN